MDQRLEGNPGYLIDQNFYTVENTRDDSITDDSYFTQWEREEPTQFNDKKDSITAGTPDQTPIGPIHQKNKQE